MTSEQDPHDPAVTLSNGDVRLGFWLDERIKLVECAIGLGEHWQDNPARHHAPGMVVRFAQGDLSELKPNYPGAELSDQVRVCLAAFRKYGQGLLAGNKVLFQQLDQFARGYSCRYTEEMAKPRPVPQLVRRRFRLRSAILFFLLGAASAAAAIVYWAIYAGIKVPL